jgi:hypothetical protein
MAAEQKPSTELTEEQWAAGREIAEDCDLSEEILGQTMLWNGRIATVGYGLAHSARYMDDLTTDEIRAAIFNGMAAYQAMANADGSH